MFLGKLVILTAGIIIIYLHQFSLISDINLDVAQNSFLHPITAIDSGNRCELLPKRQTTVASKIYDQNRTVQCLNLLSMSSKKPVSELDSPMKIEFRQSGGYAGLTKGCEINTAQLPAEDAKKLKSLIEQSGILESQNNISINVADAYKYHLVIETIRATYKASFNEQNLSEEVIPLIDFLEERSDYIKQN